MNPITITLPIPSRDLSPNGRGHWSKKYRAVKALRTKARQLCRVALGRRLAPQWVEAMVQVEVVTKTRTRPDRDNLLASLKGAFDGAQDAGIIADDSGFHYAPVRFLEPDRENARVILTFSELPATPVVETF